MPGRPPKPTSQLAPDAFRHNPNRRRDHEPAPNGPVGDPPDEFDNYKKAIWAELVENCPPGVLTKADRFIVELTVNLLNLVRYPGIGKEGGATRQDLAELRLCLGRLGMTPSDRARVSVAKPQEKSNPFAQLDDETDGSGAFTN